MTTTETAQAMQFQCGYNDTVYGLTEPNAFPVEIWPTARDWAIHIRELTLNLIIAETGNTDYVNGSLSCCLEFLRHGSVVRLQRDCT